MIFNISYYVFLNTSYFSNWKICEFIIMLAQPSHARHLCTLPMPSLHLPVTFAAGSQCPCGAPVAPSWHHLYACVHTALAVMTACSQCRQNPLYHLYMYGTCGQTVVLWLHDCKRRHDGRWRLPKGTCTNFHEGLCPNLSHLLLKNVMFENCFID